MVLTLSILVTRIATVALVHTGLSRESARFQARSAFTGVGFTTSESERVVNHPVRRRVLLALMLLGNAGVVTALSSLVLTFIGPEEGANPALKIVLIVVGVAALWGVATSRWIDARLSRLIGRLLRRYTSLEVRDYASLLELSSGYRVKELEVRSDDWMAGRDLAAIRVRDEGILVLGIKRDSGAYVGTPRGDTRVGAGDVLVVYGRGEAIKELDERRRGTGGDREHDEAVAEQERVEQSERAEEEAAAGSG